MRRSCFVWPRFDVGLGRDFSRGQTWREKQKLKADCVMSVRHKSSCRRRQKVFIYNQVLVDCKTWRIRFTARWPCNANQYYIIALATAIAA